MKEGKRIKYYKKYGYACLIVWDMELNMLNRDNLIDKIKDFVCSL